MLRRGTIFCAERSVTYPLLSASMSARWVLVSPTFGTPSQSQELRKILGLGLSEGEEAYSGGDRRD